MSKYQKVFLSVVYILCILFIYNFDYTVNELDQPETITQVINFIFLVVSVLIVYVSTTWLSVSFIFKLWNWLGRFK